MSLKSRIFNLCNRLSGSTSALNHGEHCGETAVNPNVPPAVTRSRRRARPEVHFELPEALRMLADGWSYRKIARKMGISRETVRTRILGYEARLREGKPEPVQPPVVPVQRPAPAQQPPVATVQAEVPKAAVPVPVAPPEPVNNYDALVAYWAVRGVPNFKPDTRRFFLVNSRHGQQNLGIAANCEQLAVGITEWHKEYREDFKTADRIWVILDRREDNRAFLQSLSADIWVRERCMLVRSRVLDVCKYRLLWERDHRLFTKDPAFLLADWSDFEKAHGFQPIPPPNAVREHEAWLAPPPEPERVSPVGGGYGAPYGPMQPLVQIEDRGDERCGFAF